MFTNRLSKIVLTILVFTLVSAAIVAALLPTIINWQAVSWLKNQGVNATIESIDIDFDDGIFTLNNAIGANSDGRGFALKQLQLDWEWKPLLERTFEIQSIGVEGLKLDATLKDDILTSIAGIDLATLSSESAQESRGIETEESRQQAWHLQLGNVSLRDIALCPSLPDVHRAYCARLSKLHWKGKLTFDTDTEPTPEREHSNPLQLQGELSIGTLVLNDTLQGKKLLHSSSAQLNNFSIDKAGTIAFELFQLSDFHLFPDGETSSSLAQIDKLLLAKLDFKANALSIDTIALSGIGATLNIDPNGELNIQQQIAKILPAPPQNTSPKAQTVSTPSPDTPNTIPTIAIKRVELSNNHIIKFTDHSLATPFELSATIDSVIISNISSAKQSPDSAVSMVIKIDEHGRIEMEGVVKDLLASVLQNQSAASIQPDSFDLHTVISGVDMRPVSAYLKSSLGNRVKSGQLNADIALKSTGGQLDSIVKVDLRQFELRQISQSEREELDPDIGLPLNTVLSLLRSSDNSIKLRLPIKGDIHNPDLDFSDLIYKTIAGTITSTIVKYYSPFGLLAVAGGIVDFATALRFEPITFESGSHKIESDHLPYLEKIVGLMTERPELSVTLCGIGNSRDLESIFPTVALQNSESHEETEEQKQARQNQIAKNISAIQSIAEARAMAIKTAIISKNVAADRLILCAPEYSAKGISGVEVSI